MAKYQKPDWFTKHVFNPLVAGLTRLGIPLAGSNILAVKGRKTGEWRKTPVNPLVYEGKRYLVAPRGTTQWVRNLRVTREGELRVGRRTRRFRAEEIPEDARVPILRTYLAKWKWEVGQFFGGVAADSPEEDVRRIAGDHPIFRIEPFD